MKQVSPATCRDCYCRNHPDEAAQDPGCEQPLVDCLYLDPGPVGEHSNDGVPVESHVRLACRHPRHDWTTRDECGGCADYQFPLLSPAMSVEDVKRIRRAGPREQPEGWWRWPNVIQAQRELADELRDQVPAFPAPTVQRGIVVVGGGKYFPSAYVTVRVLRHVGTRLPIQLWHLAGEVNDVQRQLMSDLGVECVDADELRARHPFRFIDGHWWKGWQLKAYALLQCPFREVLLLDADCYPVRDPESIFEWAGYRETGAVFWPDIEHSLGLLPDTALEVFQVARPDGPPAESGQILINRERCWAELQLAGLLNAQAEFTYRWVWGDKDTFPIAWHRLQRPYSRMWCSSRPVPFGILQHDQYGDVLFQHHCTSKFTLDETRFESTPQQLSPVSSGLPLQGFCRSALEDLRRSLYGRLDDERSPPEEPAGIVLLPGHPPATEPRTNRLQRCERSGLWIRSGALGLQDGNIIREVIDADVYGIAGRPCSHPEVVVDVGAHIGSFAVLWRRKNPQARIVCIEACPENIHPLQANVGGFATVVAGACTYESGPIALLNSVLENGINTGGTHVLPQEIVLAADNETNHYWKDLRTVRKYSLEDILDTLQADRIDVLKLDCETSEFSILEHTPSLHCIRFICGEFHGRERWERFRERRFPGWTYRLLSASGDLGIFHLENPAFKPRRVR